MDTIQGFSLTEVLIALLLLSTTSLALLKQEWQITQFFQQTRVRMDALMQEDNAMERRLV